MPNELPKQLYIARFVLKSSAQFDVITEMTREEITKKLIGGYSQEFGYYVTIPGINIEKGWPVDLVVLPEQVDAFFHGPYQQWLAGRPNLSIS